MATSLPHNFTPRRYQVPALKALDNGARRAVAVWHRRAGKEKTFLNYTAAAASERIGAYFYFFPTFKQGRKVLWDGRDRDGFRFLDHFPPNYIAAKNEAEMKLTLINGSIFQIVGTDNFDAIMGSNPVGCVFSEYALQDPRAWDYIRPILAENDGWAIFDYTPRGKNHGYTLYELGKKLQAEGDPRWFVERLTVNDTGAITPAQIDAERREGMSEDMIQQEYFCSFEGVMQGSIFGKQMDQAEQEGRICAVPWQPEFPVSTWWDVGTSDATAIWFTQDVGKEIHVIDYYENAGTGVGYSHYAKLLQSLPYLWGTHNGPHDMEAHQFAADGKSAKEQFASLGLKFTIVDRHDRQDGIQAARPFLQRCWFDRNKTERGRLALVSYHYQWDEKRVMFSTEPYHDWASNGSDAFRYLAVGHKTFKPPHAPAPPLRTQWEADTRETAWMNN